MSEKNQGKANERAAQATPGPSTEPSPEAIARRAYELYLQRGSVSGYELEDWLQAEAELRSASKGRRPK